MDTVFGFVIAFRSGSAIPYRLLLKYQTYAGGYHRQYEDKPVDPVHDTAMTGNKATRVLDPETSFKRGFRKVSRLLPYREPGRQNREQ